MAGVVTLILVSVTFVSGGPSAPAGAAPVECTNPPPAGDTSLTPQALRERYGISPLLDAGHDGRGQTAVLIEFKQSVDLDALADWQACMHVDGPPVTQKAMPGEVVPPPPSPCGAEPLPACFGEAQGDAYSIVAGAPGLDRLYIIVSNGDERDVLATIVDGLRTGDLTDGRPPDVVSLSFASCQPVWSELQVARTETALRELAASGTWFFKAAGDAGPSDCSPHPRCKPDDKGPAMGYPAASPWVTAVGGTSIPGGSATEPNGEPVVWNDRQAEPNGTDNCSAGAGGLSIFDTPTYQHQVPGGAVPTKRGLPDVAALAGSPGYLNLTSSGTWFGNGGTSLASPLYAAAFASIRSKLVAEQRTHPAPLNDALYRIASDPARYERTFRDVVKGDNDIYGVGCCTAASGFDLASGLGELRIDELAEVLSATQPPIGPPTSTTSTTTAASPASPASPRPVAAQPTFAG